MPSQQLAILQVLTFLGTAALFALAVAAAAWLALRGARRAARLAAATALVLAAAYVAVLVVVGVASGERVLPFGAEKYFCEIDCHLAYRVTGVRTMDRIGDARPVGRFHVVTLATRFDERTTSPGRPPDALLRPGPRRVRMVDAGGRAWPVSAAGQRALSAEGDAGTPLDRPLPPGVQYETRLVFDLPRGVREPRLELTTDLPIERVLIGHERAPFHAKALFALEPSLADRDAR